MPRLAVLRAVLVDLLIRGWPPDQTRLVTSCHVVCIINHLCNLWVVTCMHHRYKVGCTS